MNLKKWDKSVFLKELQENGYCIVEDVIDQDTISALTKHTALAIEQEADYHATRDHAYYGTIQACPMYGGPFLSLLDNRKLMQPFDIVMGEGSIIWTYISSSMPPRYKNFSTRIHVDRPRFFANYLECLGSVIYLTDVYNENGSTWVMPGSHTRPDEPTEEEFYSTAVQIQAKAGSVFYFNTRLWHAGGFNHTDEWRHALGIGVVRPYLKQKFDFPRIVRELGIDENELSLEVRQKLGFFAIPPASLDQFWVDEKRSYREKSEWEMVKLGF